MTVQELLQADATVREHFRTWAEGKLKGNLDSVIAQMSQTYWRAFARSEQGLACYNAGIKLGEYQVSGEKSAVPVPAKAQPKEQPKIPRKICIQCGLEFPSTNGHLMCGVCIADSDQHTAPQPVIPAPVAPALTESPNPLMVLIAQELRAMGFTPQQSVSAQQCQSIAEEAALGVAEIVLEQLRKEGLGTTKHVVEIREPGKVTKVEGRAPVWFPRLRKLAACRVPALLVGPPGSGKTTAAKKLAESMELPFHRVSIAAGTDEGQLQGWLHPIGDNMKFEYVSSVVSHAYEQGGVVLIDDIDLGDPNALGILNAVCDNGGWHIPLRHANPVFNRDAKFYLMGAANTWCHGADRKHVGANQLDERTLSRFRMGQIYCDYDPDLEKGEFDPSCVQMGQMIRARCRALPSFPRDCSTRDIESATTMLQQFSLAEAWYGYFADWSQDELTRVHANVNHVAMTAYLD